MQKETLLPFVGKKVVIKDIFGDSKRGYLKSVGEDSLTLVKNLDADDALTIVATQYIFFIKIEK